MNWGIETYGCDAFRICRLEVAQVERAETRGAKGPT
jgi:hypothetical protein